MCGQEVLELIFDDIALDENELDERGNEKFRLTEDLLASVLERTANIRFLRLDLTANYMNEDRYSSIPSAMAAMKFLEALWIRSQSKQSALLGELCETLPSLQRLKFLSIDGLSFKCDGGLDTKSRVHAFAPPSSLKIFSIGRIRDENIHD